MAACISTTHSQQCFPIGISRGDERVTVKREREREGEAESIVKKMRREEGDPQVKCAIIDDFHEQYS